MWLKILETNWKSRYEDEEPEDKVEPAISENSDTQTVATSVKTKAKVLFVSFRQYYGYPVFGAAVLAILIMGERNLFSQQVRYQTEPVVNIGQWAPIVGTALALLGSLYMVLAEAMKLEAELRAHDSLHAHGDHGESDVEVQLHVDNVHDFRGGKWMSVLRPLASLLLTLSNYIGIPAYKRYDDSSFQNGHANAFPEIPAERSRVRELDQIQTQWRPDRSVAGSQRSRSRAGSGVSQDGVEHIEVSQTAAARHPRRDTGDTLKLPSPVRTRSQTTSSAPLRRSTTTTTAGSQNPPAIVLLPIAGPSSLAGAPDVAQGGVPTLHSGA
ncbi:hypothetical protein LTR08_005436 [Meristemomyces frigidus]|nr:hypothetical protein LTR08_005436 [Meristemomyces frigidus]